MLLKKIKLSIYQVFKFSFAGAHVHSLWSYVWAFFYGKSQNSPFSMLKFPNLPSFERNNDGKQNSE